ncbi:MAG TPA: cytochrome c [Pirellulales bacterium]|jgi:mono/diheme cytochrome c family protein
MPGHKPSRGNIEIAPDVYFRRRWFGTLAGCCVALVGCRQEMADQPRYESLEPSTFFADGASARQLVQGTVARGHKRIDRHLYEGRVDGEWASEFPFAVTHDVLERGQQRFNIFCAPCHDRTGSGQGIVVERGYPRPPDFTIGRLRDAPVGHFFDVITNGYRLMPPYAAQVPPRDRWAIVGYIRALQLSRHATLDDVPTNERARLQESSLEGGAR